MANPTFQEENNEKEERTCEMVETIEIGGTPTADESDVVEPQPIVNAPECNSMSHQENESNSDNVSSMELSTAELDESGGSPEKVSTSGDSDSNSDTLDSLIPAKKQKKNNGTAVRKKTMDPFIQEKDCEKLQHKLGKCLECKLKPTRIGRKGKDSICRFLAFRKLRYNDRGSLTVAGFPDSSENSYTPADISIWTPNSPPVGMSYDLAKFLLKEVGDQFCQLVKQEKETLIQLNGQENKMITWRRVVENLRELCDVCTTTLFNYHWTCGKCGFVVCVSCFNARRTTKPDQVILRLNHNPECKDNYNWLRCHAKEEHSLKELMMTQIVTGRALDDLWLKLHDLRRALDIPEECGCNDLESAPKLNVGGRNLVGGKPETGSVNLLKSHADKDVHSKGEEGKKTLEDETKKNTGVSNMSDDEDADDQGGIVGLFSSDPIDTADEKECTVQNAELPERDAAHNSKARGEPSLNGCTKADTAIELKNFIRKGGPSSSYSIKVVPKIVQSQISSRKFKEVPHAWLCSGLLLQLKDPSHPRNIEMFQEQWKRGQPVIVSNVGSKLDKELWTPDSFSRDFGRKTNNLINCMTGNVVPNQKMKKFWDGFEHVKQRLRDGNGVPMLLKLKDWPPSDDFAKLLPDRFKDLMSALPLGEYTHRDGLLNLAARLPDIFCKPDLGPKMYIAYGSGLHLDKGTTNLHLDMSDAVNVMVYVGVVKDEDNTKHDEAVMKAIEDSDCDLPTIRRVAENKELPGALWHIWEAKDADKIRDMMNKIALEKGVKIERHHDSIHDQSWYLDAGLRKRLREEYNVVGYPILQCQGDAVFIPAGAPHQVRNLNNCIKIAEDFVSPENVGHCFYLTEEFRNLTETHTNHEDKLQIKNIVYHTVKDAVAVILDSQKQT